MGRAEMGLALAWLSPILLGFVVAFILLRFDEHGQQDKAKRPAD